MSCVSMLTRESCPWFSKTCSMQWVPTSFGAQQFFLLSGRLIFHATGASLLNHVLFLFSKFPRQVSRETRQFSLSKLSPLAHKTPHPSADRETSPTARPRAHDLRSLSQCFDSSR